jgi:hypothetical protein
VVLQCHRLVTPTRLFGMQRRGWHVDAGNRWRHVALSSALQNGGLGASLERLFRDCPDRLLARPAGFAY